MCVNIYVYIYIICRYDGVRLPFYTYVIYAVTKLDIHYKGFHNVERVLGIHVKEIDIILELIDIKVQNIIMLKYYRSLIFSPVLYCDH